MFSASFPRAHLSVLTVTRTDLPRRRWPGSRHTSCIDTHPHAPPDLHDSLSLSVSDHHTTSSSTHSTTTGSSQQHIQPPPLSHVQWLCSKTLPLPDALCMFPINIAKAFATRCSYPRHAYIPVVYKLLVLQLADVKGCPSLCGCSVLLSLSLSTSG